jgi:type I restriction enzyme S subunit
MMQTMKPLDEVAEFRLGKMLDDKKNKGEPLPYLANINVRWGEFDLENLREMRFEHDEMDRYGLKYGDIVMCEGGEPGRCAIWKESVPGMMIQKALHRIRPHDCIDHRFLFYSFVHKGRIGTLAPLFTGATIKHLPREKLAKVEIAFPSLAVQRRIADILSAYDDLIENNRRRMALLEDAARQLYREWFFHLRFPGHEHTRITNGVPEGWEKTTALSAMEVLSGGTPKTTMPDYWDGEIPFYTPKDASDTAYVLQTERRITELGLKNCNSRLYDTNTVFISARGTVGKLNLAARPMAMSQSCYALIGREYVPQMFLFCALKEAIEHFKQHAGGAVFDAIIVDTFKLIPFMVPEEKRVRLFEEATTPIFRQVANVMEQNEKLRAARDLLLPRLMSGEIAV